MQKILIVDDSFEDLQTMKTILEKEGYGVTTVTNGAQALDSLRGNGFELILIDVRMPILSGYELLQLLREKINHHSKLVYVSIVPKKEVDVSGADGFIQKPFSPETLSASVKKMLNKRGK
jgi:two-component system response regulator SaeR